MQSYIKYLGNQYVNMPKHNWNLGKKKKNKQITLLFQWQEWHPKCKAALIIHIMPWVYVLQNRSNLR